MLRKGHPIIGISVLFADDGSGGGETLREGFRRIPCNLNDGSMKGKEMYLCFQTRATYQQDMKRHEAHTIQEVNRL